MILQPENMPYVFFSVIGSHSGEDIHTILNRKANDICKAGESFWVAKITKYDFEVVRNLSSSFPVYLALLESSSNGHASLPTKVAKKAVGYSKDLNSWQPLPMNISDVTGNINTSTTAFNFDSTV